MYIFWWIYGIYLLWCTCGTKTNKI
jgi:hypothetical protein